MAGLDKIISQIRKESQEAAEKKIAAARKEAEEILSQTKLESDSACDKILEDTERTVTDILSRGRSAADLKRRQGLLACKQRLIGQVLEEARRTLEQMPGEEYAQSLIKLIKKTELPPEGTLCFSGRDLDRLPSGFEKQLNDAVKERNSVLHISDQSWEIDGGFILSYGGIEENCTFDSLFDSYREVLQDTVQKILFP